MTEKNKKILKYVLIGVGIVLLIGGGIFAGFHFFGKKGGLGDYFTGGKNSSALDYSELAYGTLDSLEKEILDKDQKSIKKYIDDKDLKKFKRTDHGVFYRIEKEGNGIFAERGDKVWMHSLGVQLDGKKFFSTYDHKQTLLFTAFTGQMVPGFDEAIEYFDEGSEGIVLVPSPLAYSDQIITGLPKYSIMRFDIKIVKIKKIPHAQTPPPRPKDEPGILIKNKDKDKQKVLKKP